MADPELPILEPPPGGLAMLRDRLDAVDRRAARMRRFAIPMFAVVAAAAVAIVLWLAPRRPPRAPAEPNVAMMPLPDPSIGNGVAFYWVSPTEITPNAATPSAPSSSTSRPSRSPSAAEHEARRQHQAAVRLVLAAVPVTRR